jgi:hypothetical protein
MHHENIRRLELQGEKSKDKTGNIALAHAQQSNMEIREINEIYIKLYSLVVQCLV